jgi:predicted metal-dependent phosphoesterase TrpH
MTENINQKKMKFDLHVHSHYSQDGNHSPEEIVRYAKNQGLSGIAITDHNSVSGHAAALKASKEVGEFIVIRGIEVSTISGHVLGYGISEPIKKGLSVAETIDKIISQGGVAIAAHPYRLVSGIGEFSVRNNRFDGIEIFNRAISTRKNEYAKILASQLDSAVTGGSDAHILEEIGLGYTLVSDVSNEDELIKAIKTKRTESMGTSVDSLTLIRKMVTSTFRWVSRGMVRI